MGLLRDNPILWLVIGIPLTSIFVGIIMGTISFKTFDGTVVDDYYKHGKEINRVLERDTYAADARLVAQITQSADRIEVALNADYSVLFPDELVLSILHPTRTGYDIDIPLSKSHGTDSSAQYSGDFDESTISHSTGIGEGHWFFQMETATWRLNQRIDTRNAKTETGQLNIIIEARQEPQ